MRLNKDLERNLGYLIAQFWLFIVLALYWCGKTWILLGDQLLRPGKYLSHDKRLRYVFFVYAAVSIAALLIMGNGHILKHLPGYLIGAFIGLPAAWFFLEFSDECVGPDDCNDFDDEYS